MARTKTMLPPATTLGVALGLLTAMGPARGADEVPVVDTAAESAALLERAAAQPRVYFSNLAEGNQGVLLDGVTAKAIPAGRYRLHAPMAMSPLGHITIGGVRIRLAVAEATTEVLPMQFRGPDRFEHLTLDFAVHGPAKPTVRIDWSVPDEDLRLQRDIALQSKSKPVVPDSDLFGDDDDLDLGGGLGSGDTLAMLEGDSGFTERARALEFKHRLLLQGVHVERLAPVELRRVRTDRITYRPGATAAAHAELVNHSAAAQDAELSVVLRHGMDGEIPLHHETLHLGPGKTTDWDGSFTTDGLYWGAELECRVTCAGFAPDVERAAFGVASNLWQLAIMTTAQTLGLVSRPDMDAATARRAIANARAGGYTGFEAFFWAPCDMLEFTPDTDRFFGCQGGYPGTVHGTRNVIEAGHAVGIAATVYANLWGAAGMTSIDMMQKHPDWFGQAEFKTYYVDDWPLMQEGRLQAPCGVWIHNQLNLEHGEPLFDRHAREVIGSHEQFGWDATRYDSYYSSDWTKKATARVRALVEEAVPGYQWGYNSIATGDRRAGALDIMVGGGGLVMEEGLSRITKSGGTLGMYADKAGMLRDIIWPHGGHLGLIYGTGEKTAMPHDELYLSSILLAAGAHPYYGRLHTALGDYPAFALRYADVLWNNTMRPLADPPSAIAIPDAADFLRWEALARTQDRGEGRRRLVLHLINAPADYPVTANLAMAVPPPREQVPVEVTLPADARAVRAWVLTAAPQRSHTDLPVTRSGTQAKVTIPEVRFWTALVMDYEASVPIAARQEGAAQ